MGPNRISASLDNETIDDIQASLEKVRTSLPFLLQLVGSDRPSLVHIGDELSPFLKQSVQDAQQNPDLVPPSLDVDELERDYKLFLQLTKIMEPLEELLTLLHDTSLAAGSDAFDTALIFYKNVRMAARLGDPKAQQVLDDLKSKVPTWKNQL